MLAGKRLLITGVLTKGSIAYSVAERAQQEGAEIVLTGFGRTRRMTERSAARLPEPPDVLELDVNNADDFTALVGDLESRWGGIDGALHAIAFAPGDALGGNFMTAPPESAELAFRTSAYSFKALGEALAPLMTDGGSLVGKQSALGDSVEHLDRDLADRVLMLGDPLRCEAALEQRLDAVVLGRVHADEHALLQLQRDRVGEARHAASLGRIGLPVEADLAHVRGAGHRPHALLVGVLVDLAPLHGALPPQLLEQLVGWPVLPVLAVGDVERLQLLGAQLPELLPLSRGHRGDHTGKTG